MDGRINRPTTNRRVAGQRGDNRALERGVKFRIDFEIETEGCAPPYLLTLARFDFVTTE